jgi:biopolymer transport protein ExbB
MAELLISGGWAMVPLYAMSVVVVSLIVYYFLTLREANIITAEMERRLPPYMENEDVAGLAAYVAERPQAVARVLDAVTKFLRRNGGADADAIKSVATAEGTRLAAQMNQRVVYLMDLGVLAPMVGLMGTVVGILKSFGSIATEASSMRTMLLAGGVSQALVCTAVGLLVGITAMAFYSYFRGRVQYLISLMEGQCATLVAELILLQQNRRA